MTSWVLKFTSSSAYLSNQCVFLTFPESHDKNLNILRTKGAFKMKLKAFFIIFKGLSMKEIIQFFVEVEHLRTTASWQKKKFSFKKREKEKRMVSTVPSRHTKFNVVLTSK